jgi:subtilisin family serine protease
VVLVADTGLLPNDSWLGVRPDPMAQGGYTAVGTAGTAPFAIVDLNLQASIAANSSSVSSAGDQPRQIIRGPWDDPVTIGPLNPGVPVCSGHGTFIAGIIRQLAPDAQVLSVRIMHPDAIVYEGDLLYALAQIRDQVCNGTRRVDVISLSLGYFSENQEDATYSATLRPVVSDLTGHGIAVVAAAGNFATTRRYYPAAWAAQAPEQDHAPVLSVGALNPNDSQASFSNGGPWVRVWANGAAVVSTFPTVINGGLMPASRMAMPPSGTAGTSPAARREPLDPDNYHDGYATWSGTSFAAPELAARIAAEMTAGAGASPADLGLAEPGPAAALRRTVSALESLGWSPDPAGTGEEGQDSG